MKNPITLAVLLAATAMFAAACGGDAALGEECGEAGVEEGECEAGAICGKASDASADLSCLKICTDQAECAANEGCNGVEGTNVKACRPE
jgi:hypothetical protein